MTNINELDVQPVSKSGAENIAQTDAIHPLLDVFQQLKLPSLGRILLENVHLQGPSSGIFAIKTKKSEDDSENLTLARTELECLESKPINTGITNEAYTDLCNTYGKVSATTYLAKMLRSFANEQENTEFLKFLDKNAVDAGTLQLSDAKNAETRMFEITNSVETCVLQMNSLTKRTFRSWAIIPYKFASAIMTTYSYQGTSYTDVHDLRVADNGLTAYFINPDPKSTTAYVGLTGVDGSPGTGYFGAYRSDLQISTDSETGNSNYFLFNRYGFAMSPLHEKENPMLFKFTITDK